MTRRKTPPPPSSVIEVPACWPDGSPRSRGNAFTSHFTDPQSSFLGQSGFRPMPPQLIRPNNTRYQDADKSKVFTIKKGATA